MIGSVLVSVLITAGCAGESSGPRADQARADSTAEDPRAPRQHTVGASVRVHVSGAHDFVWEGSHEVGFVRMKGDVNFLSGGFEGPQALAEDPRVRFRWAFDLVNQYHDEPSELTIDAPAPGQTASSAYFTYMEVRDGSKHAVFDWDEVEVYQEFKQVETCVLQLGTELQNGELRCPRLREDGGQEVAVTIRWRRP